MEAGGTFHKIVGGNMLKKLLVLTLLANSNLLLAEEVNKPAIPLSNNTPFEISFSTNIRKVKNLDKTIFKQLTSEEAIVRRNTVIGLGGKGKTENLSALLAMLYDKEPVVQGVSVRAITSIGDVRVSDFLIDKFNKTADVNIQSSIISSLGELKSNQSLPFLETLLKNTFPVFRHEALKSIGKLNIPETYPLIVDMLKDESEGIRITAARICVELNLTNAVPLLLKNLNDPIPVVRSSCAAALGSLGDKASIKELKKLLKDKDELVKAAATTAIAKIQERLK